MLSRGVSRSSIDFFGLTVLTNCVGNHSNLPEKFGFRNFLCIRTENHVFQTNFIVSEYAIILGNHFLVSEYLGSRKLSCISQFSFDFFYLTVPKNFLRNHLKFQNVSNVRCRKDLCKRMEYHDFPSKFFCLGAEKFRWGTLRYIRKVRLSKNFLTECLISLFSVEFFSRIMPTKFVGEPPCVSESLGHRILYAQGRALQFSVGFFGLPVLKNFLCNPFNLPENFGNRNFLCMRTENHVLQSIFFVPQYAKVSRELLLSFRIFGISKTFMHITVFLRFFCLRVPKNFVRNHLTFQKVSNFRY